MPNRITVGISVYGDWEYLDMLLQSIRWYTYEEEESFDIVVCDDGTKAKDLELFNKIGETTQKYGASFLYHEQNQGIPATWNHLANSLNAESEIIVILNNDLLVVPNWLKVATHFLDANKDNPHVGSCYWNPVNGVPKDMMKLWLPTIGHTTYELRDQRTGKQNDFNDQSHTDVRVGANQGLGRVMCPCGCCFAFTRKVWNECGPFPEHYRSFHEESLFGTHCAQKGRASFGFAYPRPYHTHGAAFASNPELNGSQRMAASRRMYRAELNIPESIPGDQYFKWVDDQLMPKIPKTALKFLRPNYDLVPETRTLVGGEEMLLPALEEVEDEF
jgi:cellulose synthase/poly-beta-1,6-N-acetylglucosamine synthase-like glycosyltransferase